MKRTPEESAYAPYVLEMVYVSVPVFVLACALLCSCSTNRVQNTHDHAVIVLGIV